MPDTPTRAEHRERSEEHVAEARRLLAAHPPGDPHTAARIHATLALAVATQGLLLPEDPEEEPPARGFPHPTPRGPVLPPGRRP